MRRRDDAELRRRDTQTEAILAKLSGHRPIPSHKSARLSREGEFYDYNAAIDAGYGSDISGHWPSGFKLAGHPNTVVGGFHTVTAKRVPGTRRLYGDDLVAAGWDKETAKELDAVPEPIVSPMPSHTTPAPDAYQGDLNDVLLGGRDAAMRAPTRSERVWGEVEEAGEGLRGPLKLALGAVGLDPQQWVDRRATEAAEDRQYQAQIAGLTDDEIVQGLMAGTVEPPVSIGVMADLPGLSGGFLSRLDDAIDLIPVKGAHPNKVASLLSRASKEELEYRGVPAFLAAQGNTPVTREALRAHLGAHPAPVPQVKTTSKDWLETPPSDANPYNQPRYDAYQVPGGTNYRETVLTLPNERLERAGQALEEFEQRLLADVPITTRWSLIREDGSAAPSYHTRQAAEDARWNPAQRIEETPTRVSPQLPAQGTPLRDEYERLRDAVAAAKRGDQYQYQSPHFDEPNVLVHTRSNERTLPTGERGRFLEEVQSDWHQRGKQEGYRQPVDEAMAYAERTDGGAARFYDEEEVARAIEAREKGVPDAPFKDSWQDLGFKQQLLEVADDPTLDWIGWTSGKTQAARYDLSKEIGQVTARPTPDGRVHLEALTPDMDTFVVSEVVSLDKLDGIIGKEIAEKIRAGIRFPASPRHYARGDRGVPVELTGLDLEVGGEGMVEFYDRLLPRRVAKIVKPFGGTVEQMSMGAGQPDQWVVRLTPEMKAKIKQGLPLLALPAGVQVSASRPEED